MSTSTLIFYVSILSPMAANKGSFLSAEELNKAVISCSKCTRLVKFRNEVLSGSARYSGQMFWRKPIPGYGDIDGRIMVVGLAPAASGANRTGRVFTGDKSSEILVSAFYRNGLSNQESSTNIDDGLEYRDMLLTLAVRCVPPDNVPTREEKANCLPYLEGELSLITRVKSIVALGTVAFESVKSIMKNRGFDVKGMKFSHGSFYEFEGLRLYSCYHPSPRNINTGRTSLEDITEVIGKARDYAFS